MGNINTFAKLAIAAALILVIWGGWQLHERSHAPPQLQSDWTLEPNYHAIDGARSTARGKDLDLSDRDLVFRRQRIQAEAEALAKATKDSEKKQAAAEPTIQEDQKKQKAKKKTAKKNKPKKRQAPSSDQQNGEESTEIANTPDAPKGVISRGGGGRGARTSQANVNILGEQQWRQLLLSTPDATVTGEFIQAYSSRQVSQELFYLLIEEMILDPREEMQEMGRRSLDATPSFESFRLLAYYESVSHEPMRSRFFRSLDVYASKDHLGILETALQSNDEAVQIHATKLVHVAVQQIRDSVLQQPATNRSVRGFRTIAEVDDYERFIPVLNDLSRSANQTLSNSAYDALNELNRIINS